jgi:hypothetical protein
MKDFQSQLETLSWQAHNALNSYETALKKKRLVAQHRGEFSKAIRGLRILSLAPKLSRKQRQDARRCLENWWSWGMEAALSIED